ncbi:MAG: DUF1292 domain-containing protein [Tissierellia bacterium]|nr:DUF1292 domain-containing protein [Tissierellia bacterium]
MHKEIFTDEMGNEIEFTIKATFKLDDQDYIVMIPTEEIDSPTYILRVEYDEDGNEVFVGIDDEELSEASKAYEELMQDEIQ